MFNNLKIGKRLALAFGVSIVLVAVAGLTGFWGLSQTVETTYGILHHDAKLMQEASPAQVNGLQLRRYEKDTFLNIGDQQKSADYSEKWKGEHAELDAHLNALEQATTLPADKETVRGIRTDLSTYTIGFQSVVQQISEKTIKSPVDANAAMVPFKDDIRRMDTALEEFAAKNIERMNSKEKVVLDSAARTRGTMWAVFIAGILIVLFMTVAVTRSITRPILKVVSIAEKLAEGESDLQIDSRAAMRRECSSAR